MKVKYITVDLRSIKGIEKAEKLHMEGWKENSSSFWTIVFYKKEGK